MRRRLIPVLVLVALVAVACGDDESVFDQGSVTTAASTTSGAQTTSTGGEVTTSTSATTTTQAGSTTLGGGEQAMADQIAADLLADAEPGTPVTEQAAQCLGNQLVATFGVERLQALAAASGDETDLGAALEQMTPDEQATLVGVILHGVEGQAACIDVRTYLVDSLTQSGISAGSAECVADAFVQGTVIQDFLATALANPGGESEMDPEAAAQLLSVFMGCLTPEELANMGDIGLGS